MLLQSLFVVFLVNFGVGAYAQDPNLFQPHNIITTWVSIHNQIWLATGEFSVGFMLRGALMVNIAMFDAVAPYSCALKPFIATDVKPRSSTEFNDANRSKAASFAAYNVLKNLYGSYPAFNTIVDTFMNNQHYRTSYTGTDLKRPDGIGNYVAQRVIANRANDGINQYGDHIGTPLNAPNGGRYADWSNYLPVNDPQTVNGHTLCSSLRNINRWQPLRYNDQVQVWDGPHLGLVTPFALKSGLEALVTPGPALFGTNSDAEAMRQLEEILNISKNLGDREKIQGEWWGFNSYDNFAIWLARERNMGIVESVKLVALHAGAEWDSVVSGWAIKRLFDNARPISQIQCKKVGQTISAYYAPYQGVKSIQGENWQPYPLYDVISPLQRTPVFPDYVSGHSTAAGAVFEAYKRYFGSDLFGFTVTIPEGGSIVEPKVTDPSDIRYQAGITDVPNCGRPDCPGYSPRAPVTFLWRTFSEAAEAAALSRMYLGIHYRSAAFDGITVGRYAGGKAFELFKQHITGYSDDH